MTPLRTLLAAFAATLALTPAAALAHPGHDTPQVAQPAPLPAPAPPSDGGADAVLVAPALVGLLGLAGLLIGLKQVQVQQRRVELARKQVAGGAAPAGV